jgi:hypothetical protein
VLPPINERKEQMIGTQMNADFQDSITEKMLYGIYLHKSAFLSTKVFL